MNTYRFQPCLDMKTAKFPFEQQFESDSEALQYNEELTLSSGLIWKKIDGKWYVWDYKNTKDWIPDTRIGEVFSLKVREDRKTRNASAELYDENGVIISHMSLAAIFDSIRFYGLTVKNVRRDKWDELFIDYR